MFHMEHWGHPVDNLCIIMYNLCINRGREGAGVALYLVVPSSIQKSSKLGYLYNPCEYL